MLSYIRLYFGINFTDESYYIALPYRFILGNVPIKDEYSICQFAGIILYPFYYIYLKLNHSTDAIVLFARHLYFIFYGILTLCCYQTFKNKIGWGLALLTASICLAFTFCNIAGLSYNSLAIFFLTLGCLCNFILFENANKTHYYFLSGICFSLTTFVYPPLLIIALLSMFILCRNDWRYTLNHFTLGTIPVLTVVILLIQHTGITAINHIYQYLHNTGYIDHHYNHALELYNTWKTYTPDKILLFSLLIVYLLTYRIQKSNSLLADYKYLNRVKSKNIYKIVALAIPITLIVSYLLQEHGHSQPPVWWDPITDCYTLLINICLLAPFYIFLLPNRQYYKHLFITIWFPSFIAGIVTVFASANSIANSLIGLFPALIASIIIIGQATKLLCNSLITSKSIGQYIHYVPHLFTMILLTILFVNKYSFAYQDEPLSQITFNSISHLTLQIQQGPFKYLYTTPDLYNANQSYYTDLNSVITDHNEINSMLIYPGFSAGYLYSHLTPATNSVWLFNMSNQCSKETIAYLQNKNISPDILCITQNKIKNNMLINYLLHSGYALVKTSALYDIYVKNSLNNSENEKNL